MASITLKFTTRPVRRELTRFVKDLSERELMPYLRRVADEAERVAIGLAEDRLQTNRDPERRRGGTRYVDSFDIGFEGFSEDRVRIAVRNTHHFARGLENGSPAHKIEAPGGGAFPVSSFRPGDYESHVGPFFKYGPRRPITAINHPGSAEKPDGYHIMRDTADEIQGRAKARAIVRLVPRVR